MAFGDQCILLRLVRLHRGEELDSRADVVDVLPDMLWDVVLVTGRNDSTRDGIFVLVVLGEEEVLRFFRGCVEREPAFVLRMRDSLGWNSASDEPLPDCFLGLIRRAKCIDDLLGSPVLAKVGGCRVRSARSVTILGSWELQLTRPSDARIPCQHWTGTIQFALAAACVARRDLSSSILDAQSRAVHGPHGVVGWQRHALRQPARAD